LDRTDPTTENRRRALPETLSLLRQKLSQKAKQEPKFRFYTLYDRIYRFDTLVAAWDQVCANHGAPGSDGVTIAQIVDADGGPLAFLKAQRGGTADQALPAATRAACVPPQGERPVASVGHLDDP
jgi:hypothetical protein